MKKLNRNPAPFCASASTEEEDLEGNWTFVCLCHPLLELQLTEQCVVPQQETENRSLTDTKAIMNTKIKQF